MAERYAKLSNAVDAKREQVKFVNGQLADLQKITTNAGLSYKAVEKPLSPSFIAAEGGVFAPKAGKAITYWYWSTASSIAHGEPNNTNMLGDMKLLGVDHRDEPVAHVEPSTVNVWNHLNVANELITQAHELWNRRARP